jgi:hypothetical protein
MLASCEPFLLSSRSLSSSASPPPSPDARARWSSTPAPRTSWRRAAALSAPAPAGRTRTPGQRPPGHAPDRACLSRCQNGRRRSCSGTVPRRRCPSVRAGPPSPRPTITPISSRVPGCRAGRAPAIPRRARVRCRRRSPPTVNRSAPATPQPLTRQPPGRAPARPPTPSPPGSSATVFTACSRSPSRRWG